MVPRRTILLADDQDGVRHLVRLTIASNAYLILEAADGDEAWAILQIMRPDVALLDVGMPGRDGFALTRAIRADPLLAETRVILLTGHKDPASMTAGRTAGADHYLTKPFSPLQLIAMVEKCLGPRGVGDSLPGESDARGEDGPTPGVEAGSGAPDG